MRRKSACIVNEKVFIAVLVVLFLSICFINKNTYGKGECISGDCKNGRGVASFSNGDKYRGEWNDGKMNGQVHDEIVLEVPEDELAATIALAKETMENAVTLDVPLQVDVETGPNWMEMH